MEEYNKDQLATNKLPKQEFSDNGKPEPIEEFGSYKKAKKIGKITSIVITIIGASLVLGSFLTFTFINNKVTTVVEEFVVEAGGPDVIHYRVNISKTNSKDVKLKLHNVHTSMVKTLEEGETIGSFVGLVANTNYEISVLEKNVVVVSKRITTYTEGA